MSRFNLLDEPWISVVFDEKGSTKEVSLLDFFQNAHHYKDLAGDTKTQDFAVLRVLLAVLHTVFSRFDANGNVYGYLEIDEKYRQIEEIEEDDLEEYEDDLYETWLTLWQNRQFPDIIEEYLKKWRDRFYLFDEEYPFFQVRREDISEDKINQKSATSIFGRNVNKTISESNNKITLFSPRDNRNKDILSASEVARWLLTFQGYTGVFDKTTFKGGKGSPSKGWIYDLGGVFVKGSNLFTTLLLNFILPYQERDNLINIQSPSWEFDSNELISMYLAGKEINNIAGLYTVWSRGIYIDSNPDLSLPFSFEIVKLPDINHQDNFLEPMTLWIYNQLGNNKGHYTPKRHVSNQSLWRSFGLLVNGQNNQRRPGIIDWLEVECIRDVIGIIPITICSVSMKDDGNTSSRMPTDEIIDTFSINEFVLTDFQENGWTTRINNIVEETKTVISVIYKDYVDDIRKIRNIKSGTFITQKLEELYFKIDQPFRQWLSGIHYGDEKDEKVFKWRGVLKKLVHQEAKILLQDGGPRDYIGIVDKDNETVKNIVTAYESFNYRLNKNLKEKK